jgi:hypothetical protein
MPVDTLKFTIPGFEVRRRHRLTGQTTLSPDGEVVGEKQYANLSGEYRANLTIEAHRPGSPPVLSVSTSAPKLLRRTSLREVSESDLEPFGDAVHRLLDYAGVEVAPHAVLDTAKVNRVDFCRNIGTVKKPMEYLATLSQFGMTRRAKREIDGDYLRWGNTRRQLVAYDKVLEVQSTEDDPEVLALAEKAGNILRVECRALRADSVRTLAGVSSGAVRIPEVWNRALARKVILADFEALIKQGERPDVDLDALTNSIIDYRRVYPRGGFGRLLQSLGAVRLMEQLGFDFGKLKNLLASAGYSRARQYAITRDVQRFIAASIPKQERGLMREVRQKLAA